VKISDKHFHQLLAYCRNINEHSIHKTEQTQQIETWHKLMHCSAVRRLAWARRPNDYLSIDSHTYHKTTRGSNIAEISAAHYTKYKVNDTTANGSTNITDKMAHTEDSVVVRDMSVRPTLKMTPTQWDSHNIMTGAMITNSWSHRRLTMITAAFLLAGVIIDVTLLHWAMITVTVIAITVAIRLAMMYDEGL